jgi:NADPH-dependent curcumin reductase CurA
VCLWSETNSASMPRSIHRSAGLAEKLAVPCPSGIDVYFENVAGPIWQAVLPLLNRFAWVPLCGLITTAPPVPSRIYYQLRCWRSCVEACCYAATRLHQHRIRRRALRLLPAGDRPESSLRRNPLCEYIVDGLEKAPEAFIGILAGRNFGKALVRLS